MSVLFIFIACVYNHGTIYVKNIYVHIQNKYICTYTNANYKNITKQEFILHFHKRNLVKTNE